MTETNPKRERADRKPRVPVKGSKYPKLTDDELRAIRAIMGKRASMDTRNPDGSIIDDGRDL